MSESNAARVSRSSRAEDWPLDAVMCRKGVNTIGVVLPTYNNEETVGRIVTAINAELMEAAPLIDELVVMDGGSTDATAKVAAEAGASVFSPAEVFPALEPLGGRGDLAWTALAATSSDMLVFLDPRVRDFHTPAVSALLGPLLADPSVAYVKGFSDNLMVPSNVMALDGGRVAELMAHPFIEECWPRLAGFAQPLSTEHAGRREALESVPFACGHGFEIGLLLDLYAAVGSDALAQVEIGMRMDFLQPDDAVKTMVEHMLLTTLSRLQRQGYLLPRQLFLSDAGRSSRTANGTLPRPGGIQLAERPPMRDVRVPADEPYIEESTVPVTEELPEQHGAKEAEKESVAV